MEKEINAKIILNSRQEKTIEIIIKTDDGIFAASTPSGKSKGANEKEAYKNTVEDDVKKILELSDKLEEVNIEHFSDLQQIENITRGGLIGANTLYALEIALLKAAAASQGKQLWQFLNPNAKKFPFPIGNVIGGGLHSQELSGLKLDFQEFLIIPKARNFSDNVFLMRKAHGICHDVLKERKALGKLNDEGAWTTSLNNEEALEILAKVRDQLEQESGEDIDTGLDVAASTFYDKGVELYNYKNPEQSLTREEQIEHISGLVENFEVKYIEDPIQEEDFQGFGSMKDRCGGCFITGDDLTVTQASRLSQAIKEDSVNAVIIKPNQVGSLIEVNKILKLAKNYNLKTIFSHRSGETLDYALADLAFASGADFVKFGVYGKEREIKLNRLISIEKEVLG